MGHIDCSAFPASQLAIKACLESFACTMANNPLQALQAQLSFASKAGTSIGAKVATQNACFLSALGVMFAQAQATMPPIPPFPTVPDVSAAVPTIPSIPSVPATPGINITFGPDGVTPLTIDF